MRKRIATLALLSVLTLAPCITANAYECVRTDLAKVHKDSTRIILGEVVKIEPLPSAQGDEVMREYVATLKPVESFRGQPNVEVRVRFSASSRHFAITFDSINIIVFTRSLDSAEYNNTRFVRTNLHDEILKLKQEQG